MAEEIGNVIECLERGKAATLFGDDLKMTINKQMIKIRISTEMTKTWLIHEDGLITAAKPDMQLFWIAVNTLNFHIKLSKDPPPLCIPLPLRWCNSETIKKIEVHKNVLSSISRSVVSVALTISRSEVHVNWKMYKPFYVLLNWINLWLDNTRCSKWYFQKFFYYPSWHLLYSFEYNTVTLSTT